MRIFQKYFRYNTSLNQASKYVSLVLKTFEADDNVEVTYEDQIDGLRVIAE